VISCRARKNQGLRALNRKHVQRLMRLMGIVALVPRPGTSKPAPGHKIYPYLLRGVAITLPSPAGRLASIKDFVPNSRH
jgi:hypothetical protein